MSRKGQGKHPKWFKKMLDDGEIHTLRVLAVKNISLKGAMFTLGHPTDQSKRAVRIWLRNPFISQT